MEPTDRPECDGFYFATLRSNGERTPVRVFGGMIYAMRLDGGADEWNIKHFCDYAEAVDPLAIKCGWYWANRIGQSNWRQVVRVVEHCDNYGDEPRLVVATAGSEKVYELTEFEQFDPLAETPK